MVYRRTTSGLMENLRRTYVILLRLGCGSALVWSGSELLHSCSSICVSKTLKVLF